jgi:hypothetical protein
MAAEISAMDKKPKVRARKRGRCCRQSHRLMPPLSKRPQLGDQWSATYTVCLPLYFAGL